MKIILNLLFFSVSTIAANPAPVCRLPSEPVVRDEYIIHTPQADCEIVSLDVLTGRECKRFVKDKPGFCYQLGNIYAREDLSKKLYTACFACLVSK